MSVLRVNIPVGLTTEVLLVHILQPTHTHTHSSKQHINTQSCVTRFTYILLCYVTEHLSSNVKILYTGGTPRCLWHR